MNDPVLIIDFGSQVTQLIARRLREVGVYTEILPCTTDLAKITAAAPRGIILSGGLTRWRWRIRRAPCNRSST